MADFLLQHEFENVDGLEDNASLTGDPESFGDFKWTLGLTRSEDSLWLSLECSSSKNVEQVKTNLKLILISLNGNRWAKQFDGSCFKFDESGVDRKSQRIVAWESIENDFLVDGKIKVQAHLEGLEVEESGVGEFEMENVFKNVKFMRPGHEMFSEKESHLNYWWRIHLMRRDDYIGIGMSWRQKFGQEFRKLRAEINLVISSDNGNRFAKKLKDAVFESKIYGQYCIQGKEIFDWESVGDFLVDGALKVEVRVNVIDSVLIPKQQTLKNDKSKEIEDFDSKLEDFDSKLEDFDSKLEDFDSKLEDFDSKLEDFDSKLEDFDSKLEDFDSKLEDFDSKLEDFDSKLEDFDSKLEDFDSKLEDFDSKQKRIEDLGTRNKDLSSDIGTLGDVVKQLTLMNEKMEKEADQLAEVNMERELKSALKSKQLLENDTLKSPAISDTNVNSILRTATEQEDLITIYQCKEFLTSKSKNSTSEMLQIAMEFNLENLKNHCLSNMTTSEQIAEIVSDLKLSGLDRPLLVALITRALELKS